MTALAALAGGCARVLISDVSEQKLAIAGGYRGITPVDVRKQSLLEIVVRETRGWGADVVFEASGNAKVYQDIFRFVRPGGGIVVIGLPLEPAAFDISAASAKEVHIETIFRYANVYERALELIASGKVDLKPLISGTYSFDQSIAAFERAAAGNPSDVKLQIRVAP
jgi:D-xylulose reductase